VYQVLLERAAEKDLKRLPPADFNRVITAIKALASVPRPTGTRKLKGSKGDYRLRVGDLRVIYEVDDRERAVRVMRVRPRDEAYK
jgi:mRNA interferase RelE/StbE